MLTSTVSLDLPTHQIMLKDYVAAQFPARKTFLNGQISGGREKAEKSGGLAAIWPGLGAGNEPARAAKSRKVLRPAPPTGTLS